VAGLLSGESGRADVHVHARHVEMKAIEMEVRRRESAGQRGIHVHMLPSPLTFTWYVIRKSEFFTATSH
jgi:hypothetical protein